MISNYPLSTEQLRAAAPAAFTAHRAGHLSDQYAHVTTANVVDALQQDGWQVVGADQRRSRSEDAAEHNTHRVTLWHPELPEHAEGRPQMYLGNSSDGTSAFRTIGGFLRAACLNQNYVGVKVVGGVFHHRGGGLENRIVAGARELRANFDRVIEKFDLWNKIELSDEQINAFKRQALALRWTTNAPVEAGWRYGRALRRQDDGRSLWLTYNRVQESLVRGGFHATFNVEREDGTLSRETRTVRKITGLSASERINTGLWELAESFAG
jgi:hypothetical protein